MLDYNACYNYATNQIAKSQVKSDMMDARK